MSQDEDYYSYAEGTDSTCLRCGAMVSTQLWRGSTTTAQQIHNEWHRRVGCE